MLSQASNGLPGKPSTQRRPRLATGVPRLFDLVKLRDRSLGVAFYYAMRDTVVAADLEQASRVAYGADRRWAKVVTLKARPGRSSWLHDTAVADKNMDLRCGVSKPHPS